MAIITHCRGVFDGIRIFVLISGKAGRFSSLDYLRLSNCYWRVDEYPLAFRRSGGCADWIRMWPRGGKEFCAESISGIQLVMNIKTPALIFVLLAVLLCGISYWHSISHPTFPPKSNVCFEMLTSSLEAAKSNPAIKVPDFSLDSITHVRCTAVPGMTNFTITATDSAGKEFHLYETIGGKAASGGDSAFDYCYTQEGKTVSQTRVTGREGKHSDSACVYNASLLPHPTDSYEYGS